MWQEALYCGYIILTHPNTSYHQISNSTYFSNIYFSAICVQSSIFTLNSVSVAPNILAKRSMLVGENKTCKSNKSIELDKRYESRHECLQVLSAVSNPSHFFRFSFLDYSLKDSL